MLVPRAAENDTLLTPLIGGFMCIPSREILKRDAPINLLASGYGKIACDEPLEPEPPVLELEPLDVGRKQGGHHSPSAPLHLGCHYIIDLLEIHKFISKETPLLDEGTGVSCGFLHPHRFSRSSSGLKHFMSPPL